MENQNIKVKVYQITTPVIYDDGINQRQFLSEYFEFERINFCIQNIARKDYINRKKTYKDSVTIWLDYYNDNYSDHYAIGKLYTVSHGVESINIDTDDLIEKARLGLTEGIQGSSLFLIDKKSGYFYITEDQNRICNKSNVSKYLYSESQENKKYLKKFREKNKEVNIDGYSRFFNLELLEPIPLLDQIKKMKSIKKIDLYPSDIKKGKKNRGIVDSLKTELSTYIPKMFKTKVELSGFEEEPTAEALQDLINYLSQSEKYEKYKLEGINEDNVRRVFSSDTMTRDLFIECDTTVEGWPKDDEFYVNVMKRIEEDDQLNIEKSKIKEMVNITAEEILQEGENNDGEAKSS